MCCVSVCVCVCVCQIRSSRGKMVHVAFLVTSYMPIHMVIHCKFITRLSLFVRGCMDMCVFAIIKGEALPYG